MKRLSLVFLFLFGVAGIASAQKEITLLAPGPMRTAR